MKPGIYPNISHGDYHADIHTPAPSLAAGICESLVYQTPLHAWSRHRRLNPNYVEKESTKFDTGTAAHALLLEGIDRMIVCPFDDWRKKEAREMRDAARENGGVPVLTHQAEQIGLMVEAAKKAFHDCVDLKGYAMADGVAENSLFWSEERVSKADPLDNSSIWLRCRPDWLSPDRKITMDAKFTDAGASPHTFCNQIINMAYDLRAAFYLRGNAATGGPGDAKYIFLVQEAKPPYASSFIGMPPAFIALGDEKVEAAIALWRRCMAAGQWPGYENRIYWAEPPAWALSQWAERSLQHAVSGLAGGPEFAAAAGRPDWELA